MKGFKSILSIILVFTLVLCVASCGKEAEGATTSTTLSADSGDVYYPNDQNNDTTDNTFSETVAPPTDTPVSTSPAASQNTPTQGETANTPQPTQAPTQTPTQAQQPPSAPNTSNDSVGEYTAEYNGNKQAVFYPAKAVSGNGTYPIIAWANGTAVSYTFYTDFLKAMAEGGYIVVANDVTMAADGTAQMASIDFIISENSNPDSVLYKKINTKKIGVAGHSQGGRCAVNVASMDSRVSCVLSVAGSNYTEEAEKNALPTFFMTGTADWIVSSSQWVKPAYDLCKGPAVYASYVKGTHTSCNSDVESYSNYAVKWFDIWLKNDDSAKKVFRNGGELANDGKWQDFTSKGM